MDHNAHPGNLFFFLLQGSGFLFWQSIFKMFGIDVFGFFFCIYSERHPLRVATSNSTSSASLKACQKGRTPFLRSFKPQEHDFIILLWGFWAHLGASLTNSWCTHHELFILIILWSQLTGTIKGTTVNPPFSLKDKKPSLLKTFNMCPSHTQTHHSNQKLKPKQTWKHLSKPNTPAKNTHKKHILPKYIARTKDCDVSTMSHYHPHPIPLES